MLRKKTHRPPGPPNPEEVQQCRKWTEQGNRGKLFPTALTEKYLQLVRKKSAQRVVCCSGQEDSALCWEQFLSQKDLLLGL